MALTTLDPRSALLVVDLQNAIVALPTVHPADVVVQKAGELAESFRAHGLPVVLVTVAGQAPGRTEQPIRSGGGPQPERPMDLPEALNPGPNDHRVTKRSRSSFTGTGLTEYLRAAGVTQVVLAGIATSIAVESSARDAYENGFNVTFALDAMTDLRAEAHEYSLTRVFPGLGESGTTSQIQALLSQARR